MEKTITIETLQPSVRRRVYRSTLVTMRAIRMRGEVRNYYDGVVHNCCRVSKVNNSLAFAIHKVGVFGGPVIEQIARPDVVQLSEKDKCVVVKDGHAYELGRTER